MAQQNQDRTSVDPWGMGLVFTVRKRDSKRHRAWLELKFLAAMASGRVAAVNAQEGSGDVELLLLVEGDGDVLGDLGEVGVPVPFEVVLESQRTVKTLPVHTLASVVPQEEEARALIAECRRGQGDPLSREAVEQLLACPGSQGEARPSGEALAEWVLRLAEE